MDGYPSTRREACSDADDLQDGRHAAPILGLALACLAYVAAHAFGRPLFYYLPHGDAWVRDVPPGAVAMGYYGYVTYGLFGFALGWALAKLPTVSARLEAHGARTLGLAATVAVAGGLLYHFAVELV